MGVSNLKTILIRLEIIMVIKREDVIKAQNYYCEHQQQNPHTPRVMQRLGLPDEDIKLFCEDNLFQKIYD